MNNLTTKGSLSPDRRRLLETMQRLNFGRIEQLEIRGGEPTFSPGPRVVQDIKLGSENGPRPELGREDFVLRAAVIELFEHLDRLGSATVAAIEVRYGLPVRLVLERSSQELPDDTV
jgi:hypothetical protein